jgi:hypothetical protein
MPSFMFQECLLLVYLVHSVSGMPSFMFQEYLLLVHSVSRMPSFRFSIFHPVLNEH